MVIRKSSPIKFVMKLEEQKMDGIRYAIKVSDSLLLMKRDKKK